MTLSLRSENASTPVPLVVAGKQPESARSEIANANFGQPKHQEVHLVKLVDIFVISISISFTNYR